MCNIKTIINYYKQVNFIMYKMHNKILKKINRLNRLNNYGKLKNRNFILDALLFLPRLPFKFVNTDKILNKIDLKIRSLDKNTDYLENFVFNIDGNIDKIKKNSFDNLIDLDFEGHKFFAFPNYHEILTKIYGDYMKLPPKSKRKDHGVWAWYI